jgi:hypothetical protein
MTQFENDVQLNRDGKKPIPVVLYGQHELDYFMYVLLTHRFLLQLRTKGIKDKSKSTLLKDIRQYYGLQSRSAKNMLIELQDIISQYQLLLAIECGKELDFQTQFQNN